MKKSFKKTNRVIVLFALMVVPLHAALSAPGAGAAVEPPTLQGMSVLPLDDQPVPDLLKDQARAEIAQMKNIGHIEAPESAVSYLDKIKEDKGKLKSLDEVIPILKVIPANLNASPLGRATPLGAMASGGHTDEGWTGLNRLFTVPKLGLVGLEEIDLLASGGGFAMIKEAINQDINGNPAILRVKKGQAQKYLTELTWATDNKVYTLSVNRALKTPQQIEELLILARGISD